jgi:hypothetical protein
MRLQSPNFNWKGAAAACLIVVCERFASIPCAGCYIPKRPWVACVLTYQYETKGPSSNFFHFPTVGQQPFGDKVLVQVNHSFLWLFGSQRFWARETQSRVSVRWPFPTGNRRVVTYFTEFSFWRILTWIVRKPAPIFYCGSHFAQY